MVAVCGFCVCVLCVRARFYVYCRGSMRVDGRVRCALQVCCVYVTGVVCCVWYGVCCVVGMGVECGVCCTCVYVWCGLAMLCGWYVLSVV